MSKVIKIFIFFVVVFLIFNKQIISHVLLYSFSKWIDREIAVDKFQISYKQNSIIINGAKIKNSSEIKALVDADNLDKAINYFLKSLMK